MTAQGEHKQKCRASDSGKGAHGGLHGPSRRAASGPKAPRGKKASRAKKAAARPKVADAVNAQAARLCPWARSCGACTLLGTPYDQQLAAKLHEVELLLKDALGPHALDGVDVLPTLGMEDPFRYRDKVASPFAPALHKGHGPARARRADDHRSGKPSSRRGAKAPRPDHAVLCGLYARGTHRVVPVTRCAVEAPVGRKVVLAVRRLMERFDMSAYDEDAQTGFMRHVVVRVGHATGEVLVTLVTAQEEWPYGRQFARQLVRAVPQVTTVVQNVNGRVTNAMLGQQEHVLFGPGFILDTVCGLTFRVSSKSFFQVNGRQTERLYRCAVEMAGMDGLAKARQGRPVRVVDAYCGTGAIGLIAAKSVPQAKVTGVESVAQAVEDARQNARHNGVGNARFVAADATEFLEGLAEAPDGEGPDVVFMDPPRAGSTPCFLSAVAKAAPVRVVYVSCNPNTQARDAKILVGQGFRLVRVQPVDMFPQTPHVESVALFERAGVANREG